MVEAGSAAIEAKARRDPREWFFAAWLGGDNPAGDASTWFLQPFRSLALAKPRISVRTRGRTATLESNVYCHGVHVRDHGKALLSDNYFDLLPGVPRTVERLDGHLASTLRFRAVMPK